MSVRSTTISVAVTVILLACIAYLEFLPGQKPVAPAVPIVSSCGDLMPGIRRIGDYGFQFDFPPNNFTSTEGWGDMPPGQHGFWLRPKNSTSELAISWRSQSMSIESVPEIAALTSSGYVEKRRIFDDKGHVIGEDSWGYWNGERWRRVHLLGWIAASYGSRNKSELASHGSVHEKDAALFDGIISSASRVPDPRP
jgi:hypothetical protein